MIDQRILRAKHVVSELVSQTVTVAPGIERQQMIGDLLEQQPQEKLYQLRQGMEYHMLCMESKEASDLDFGGIGCNGLSWYRIHGDKRPDLQMGSFTPDEADVMLLNLLLKVQRQEVWETRQLHFGYQVVAPPGPMRFRATLYFELDHLALSVRHITTEVRPFAALGLHRNVARLMSLEYQNMGLVLVTGITGSGKSSTLDTIIDANNRHSDGHIVIIADPLEHLHVSQRCVVRQREVGRDVRSFRDGVTQSLRQDPDIIVIAEMRDAETFGAVLEAADSGHKVFATLHTSSAMESIDRILGETPPNEQARVRERLSTLLTCVISQKLAPALNGKLVLAKEVMVSNAAIRSAIRNNHSDEIYQVIQQGGNEGMITMEQDLARLHREKLISYNEALNTANHKKRLEDLVKFSG